MKVTRHCEGKLHNYVIWQRNSMSDFEISVGCSKCDIKIVKYIFFSENTV